MHGHGHSSQHGVDPIGDNPPELPAEPFLTTDKAILLFGLITYGIGQSILFIVFPALVTKIGLTLQQYGFIMSASNLLLAGAAVYWGRRSDKIGRKPTLLLGLFGYALGTTGVALALEWGVRSQPEPWLLFGVILAARFVYASLSAAINPSATAYIADTTTRAQRAQGMALLGMTSGLGTILGPVIGGVFAFISVIFPMYVAIVLSLVALLAIAVTMKEPKKTAPAATHATPKKLSPWDPRIRAFLIMFFFFWMFFTIIQVTIAFYLEQVIGIEGSANIAKATSSALLAMAVLAVFMQLVVIQKAKMTPRTMLRLGMPAFGLGMLTLLLAENIYLVWVAFAFFGTAMALANPGISGGASLMVEPHEQGAVGGLLSAAPILGMSAGPLLGAWMFETIGPLFPIKFGLGAFILLSLYAFTVKVPEH